jgi:serine protease AprX
MAGIIGGRDNGATTDAFGQTDEFLGMAPGSRIVNVKVADATGAVDVSQVIAAIDWVVQHRTDHGLNIRVLNLSFGTDSAQSVALDPLSFAVEQAWKHGIVVVVAAGNDGLGTPVRNPAKDPFVIAVGAVRTDGRTDTEDVVADFTSCSTERPVDLVAPGRSIVSLRVPGSYADEHYNGAKVDDRFFKGSGTSQAAAVVSGAVALLLEQRPYLNPDQVKALLKDSASKAKGPAECRGAGMLDLHAAAIAPSPSTSSAAQGLASGTGMGSLQGARSSFVLGGSGAPLAGEIDIFGNAWDPATWTASAAAGDAWAGGAWNGASWSGASWSGASWSGASWSGASWSGASWSGASWSGASWSGASWSGASWSGASWSGASWSGASWSGGGWLGVS